MRGSRDVKLEFVGHSSYVTEAGTVRLICDPWLEGRAFNDGWELLAPTVFEYDDFHRITHIWFSHEHPDHFAPAVLRKIPEAARREITVLYQRTRDGRVVDFCRKLGFAQVRELGFEEWEPIAPGVEVRCGPWGGGDSWLCLRHAGRSILNMNDCLVFSREDTETIRELAGPVDVLATQFSISAWDGNPDDPERRRAGARKMLERLLVHIRVFEPTWVIPFASFIWFCHEENVFHNSEHNRIDAVAASIRSETAASPVVMYPGDEWTVGEGFDSEPAIERYLRDLDSLHRRETVKSEVVPEARLIESSHEFRKLLTSGVGRLRLRLLFAMGEFRRQLRAGSKGPKHWMRLASNLVFLRTGSARIWLSDHSAAYRFDLRGLRRIDLERDRCDIVLSSDSLLYAFRFLWGGESLRVNGRFWEPIPDGHERLFDFFDEAASRSTGHLPTWASLFGGLLRRVRRRNGV